MAGTFQLSILAPERSVFEGAVEFVTKGRSCRLRDLEHAVWPQGN